MQKTPKGLRLHITFLGRPNVGKSSLLNALTEQQVSIVSSAAGTTTDPVEKTLEFAPLGPVVFWDTAGIGEDGELGKLRSRRSMEILQHTDIALLITDNGGWGESEINLAACLQEKNIPFAVVYNKADLVAHDNVRPKELDESVACLFVSAHTKNGLDAIRNELVRLAAQNESVSPPILSDLLPDCGVVVLVVPLDSGAPKGRLILPQVQTIRDSLDGRKICMVCTQHELAFALKTLSKEPDLVVCDSQIVGIVAEIVPERIAMTTFSVLMARLKGDLVAFARGTAALTHLTVGQKVLIQESCSHHPQHDDIGRIKLPRLLQKLVGGQIECQIKAGKEFTFYENDLAAIVHCGACVMTRKQMLVRQQAAADAKIPMSNYGLAISLAQNVILRVLSPFPEALKAFEETVNKNK